MKKFKDVKAGDSIVSHSYGACTVMSSGGVGIYPIDINIPSIGSASSTLDGKEQEAQVLPTWYTLEEFRTRWPADLARMTRPEIAIDQFMWGSNNNTSWGCGYFAGWSLSGKAQTWEGGRTSLTQLNMQISLWKHYSLTDPLEPVGVIRKTGSAEETEKPEVLKVGDWVEVLNADALTEIVGKRFKISKASSVIELEGVPYYGFDRDLLRKVDGPEAENKDWSILHEKLETLCVRQTNMDLAGQAKSCIDLAKKIEEES